ncbi:MAG TPA: class I SAM-dependent methyltransferase [Gammaproteobacteria bacterium]|nr:class I SAM-dependent methyltransferase [Gammaproteobacteria bacterium]
MTYNDYIIDKKNSRFIGDFEGAYKSFELIYEDQFDCSRLKFNVIRHWIQKRPKAQVLDIGAGYGCFVNELHENSTKVLGLEISPSAIKKGKEMYGSDLPLQLADITNSFIPEKKFDIILCFGVLGHLLDKADICLNNIDNYLSENGQIAFSIGFSPEFKLFRNILQNEVSFVNIIKKYFHVNNFIVEYLNAGTDDYDENLYKDLIVFAEKLKNVK